MADTKRLGFLLLTFHEIHHSSSTCKLRANGGYTNSVQGDPGHSKADTLINTYSHVEDMQRMPLTNTIEKDFYGDGKTGEKSNEIDIVSLIQNDPELRKRYLML